MKQRHLELEKLVVDAWPAAETVVQDGWLLRASGGPSHRGNSVATSELALDADSEALIERVAQAEAWYAAHGQPAMFQVGPCAPRELDACLNARGYLEEGNAVFAAAAPEAVLVRAQNGVQARVDAKPDAAWFEAVRRASRFGSDLPGFQGFLRRLGTRCRYASVRDAAGNVIACCFGIASEDRLGIYAMLTLPEARRQGAARAMLHALAASADAESMRELYLLVDRNNAPARALYQAAGFIDVFEYHYRVQPKAAGSVMRDEVPVA